MNAKFLSMAALLVAASMPAVGQGSKVAWEKAHWSCFSSLNAGDLAAARGPCSEAVRIAESIPNDRTPLAQSMSNLGTLLQRLGEYSLAETAFLRSLRISEESAGKDSAMAALAAGALGLLYVEADRYNDAEPLLTRALETDGKIQPESQDVATDLNNLGLLRIKQKRMQEAEFLLNRSLSISEKLFGKNHPDSTEPMNNLGTAYFAQGNTTQAEAMFRRVLDIREASLPTMHPDIAESLNNLGMVMKGQGKFKESERLYRRCLAIAEKVMGPDHPRVATVAFNLAEVLEAQGRKKEADALVRRGTAIIKRER